MRPEAGLWHHSGWRVGLLAVGVIACLQASVAHPAGLALLLIIIACASCFWRVPISLLVRRAWPLFSFGLLALALLYAAPIPSGAPTIFLPFGQRPVSLYAYNFLLSLWIKSGLLVLWLTVFSHNLSERSLLEGLLSWRLPGRVSAIVYFIVRNVHYVQEIAWQMRRAQQARGQPRGLLVLRLVAATSQTLLVRLGRKAEIQALALTARGFQGRLPLANVRPLPTHYLFGLIFLTGLLLWLMHL